MREIEPGGVNDFEDSERGVSSQRRMSAAQTPVARDRRLHRCSEQQAQGELYQTRVVVLSADDAELRSAQRQCPGSRTARG